MPYQLVHLYRAEAHREVQRLTLALEARETQEPLTPSNTSVHMRTPVRARGGSTVIPRPIHHSSFSHSHSSKGLIEHFLCIAVIPKAGGKAVPETLIHLPEHSPEAPELKYIVPVTTTARARG